MHLNYFQPEDKPYVMKIEPHINEQQYAYRLYTKQDILYGRKITAQA